MGNTWHTNIEHFLDLDGLPAIDLSRPAELLLKYFEAIVEAATSQNQQTTAVTEIRCRRRPGRRRCEGQIRAMIDEDDPSIIRWECPVCSDRGFLYGWQGTVWDQKAT